VYRNILLPRRSTGQLLAAGFRQIHVLRPAILEGYNVEQTTQAVLAGGGDGHGTLIGNLLEDTARALGGSVTCWEPVPDGNIYHLRAHVTYP
jgi:hypothetical protein